MGRSHQRNPRCNAHPVSDGNIAALLQLFDDEQIVCDVNVASDDKAAEPQQPDPPTGEEGVPSPPLQDLLPKTPGKAHELSQVAVKAGTESRHWSGKPGPHSGH